MRSRGSFQGPDCEAETLRSFHWRHVLRLDHQPQRSGQLFQFGSLVARELIRRKAFERLGERDEGRQRQFTIHALGCAEPAGLASTEPAEFVLGVDEAESAGAFIVGLEAITIVHPLFMQRSTRCRYYSRHCRRT